MRGFDNRLMSQSFYFHNNIECDIYSYGFLRRGVTCGKDNICSPVVPKFLLRFGFLES